MKSVASLLMCLFAAGQDLEDAGSLLQTKKLVGDPDAWKDTNVGAIGSDADKAARKNAAGGEEAWVGAGQAAGVEAWRIEDFEPVSVDVSGGKFHKGDSYIVLQTSEDANSGKLSHDIFFWLGAETTTDEMGTAAYKTVELDDFFDGAPTQHREVQGEESGEFKALFGGSLNYLEGGAPSGFNHVKAAAHDTQLFVARGKKKDKSVQIDIDGNYIDDKDCFVLNAPDAIYVYCGDDSSVWDKRRANQLAERIEGDRQGQAEATHVGKAEFVLHTSLYENDEPTLLQLNTWSDEAQAYAEGKAGAKWFFARRRAPPAKKSSGGGGLPFSICPADAPFVYRPANNFDYCCASPHSNDAGDNYANAKIGRSRRAQSCKGNAYKACPSAPCHDHPNGVKKVIERNLQNPDFLPEDVKQLLNKGLKHVDKIFNPNGCPVCECNGPRTWSPWVGCPISCGAKCGSTCCCIPGVGACPNTKIR